MNRLSVVAFSLIAFAVQAADTPIAPSLDAPVQPYAPGIESSDYIWNEVKGEELWPSVPRAIPSRVRLHMSFAKAATAQMPQGTRRAFTRVSPGSMPLS